MVRRDPKMAFPRSVQSSAGLVALGLVACGARAPSPPAPIPEPALTAPPPPSVTATAPLLSASPPAAPPSLLHLAATGFGFLEDVEGGPVLLSARGDRVYA